MLAEKKPLLAEDLLSELVSARSARSGGPPALGAVGQYDGDGQEVWSALEGYYRFLEDGSRRRTEDGTERITG